MSTGAWNWMVTTLRCAVILVPAMLLLLLWIRDMHAWEQLDVLLNTGGRFHNLRWRDLQIESSRGKINVTFRSGQRLDWEKNGPKPLLELGYRRDTWSSLYSDKTFGLWFQREGPDSLRPYESTSGLLTLDLFVEIQFPHWSALLVAMVLPGLRGLFLFRRHHEFVHIRSGRCFRCGYDLRASSGRCPECGAEQPILAGQAAEEGVCRKGGSGSISA